MENDTRKGWTKQDGEDASRLLAGLVRRAKTSGEMPEQIQDPAYVPVAGERAGGRLEGLQRPPAVIVARLGGECGNGTNDNFASEVDSEPVGPGEADVRSLATSADSNINTFTMLCGNARWGKE